jgi:cyclic pyranopterin phosphate synthase
MINIEGKEATAREAVARCCLRLNQQALQALQAAALPKGDALAAARLAGILGAKRTFELIPLCHQIPLSHVAVDYEIRPDRGEVHIETVARAQARTGVEMEALTAAALAALTIYDMCKALDPAAEIVGLRLMQKSGGKSDVWRREED